MTDNSMERLEDELRVSLAAIISFDLVKVTHQVASLENRGWNKLA